MDVSASEQAILYVSSHFCDSVKYFAYPYLITVEFCHYYQYTMSCVVKAYALMLKGGRMHKC